MRKARSPSSATNTTPVHHRPSMREMAPAPRVVRRASRRRYAAKNSKCSGRKAIEATCLPPLSTGRAASSLERALVRKVPAPGCNPHRRGISPSSRRKRIDIGGLAFEVDVVFGRRSPDESQIDGSTADNSGQIPRTSDQPDFRGKASKFECRAAMAVPIERQPMLCGFIRRNRQRIFASDFALLRRGHLGTMTQRPFPPHAAQGNAFVGQTLIGIVCAPASAGIRRREVNIRYGSVMPRVTRSSIITPR